MRIPKVYLDTSVISHLDALDTPEKMSDTLLFWEEAIVGKYKIVISNIVIAEISKCSEPKRTLLFEKLSEVEYEIVAENEESLSLTDVYLQYGVLKNKSKDDLRHISVATITNCKYIISWNFKHFVNIKTIEKVQSVNKIVGYNDIMIIPPTMIIGDDRND